MENKTQRSNFVAVEAMIHLALWAFVLIAVYNGSVTHFEYQNSNGYKVVGSSTAGGFWNCVFIIAVGSLFYILVHLVLPRFKKARQIRSTIAILCVLLAHIVIVTIAGAIQTVMDPSYVTATEMNRQPGRSPDLSARSPIFEIAPDTDNLAAAAQLDGIVLIIAIIYFLIRQWVLKKMGLSAQLQKTSAELTLLKSQLNPHFLFNTLNNLYAMAMEQQNRVLADSISQLTQLMRYNIYESSAGDVTLEQEISFINNYIQLQKLRFETGDPVDIKFDHEQADPKYRLAPMLLISFVENAFKHGISLKQSSFIHIDIKTDGDGLHFNVVNSIHRQRKQQHTQYAGFGLLHVKNMLYLQYADRHRLNISEKDEVYTVSLKLDKLA